jgi:hypothetical protein
MFKKADFKGLLNAVVDRMSSNWFMWGLVTPVLGLGLLAFSAPIWPAIVAGVGGYAVGVSLKRRGFGTDKSAPSSAVGSVEVQPTSSLQTKSLSPGFEKALENKGEAPAVPQQNQPTPPQNGL